MSIDTFQNAFSSYQSGIPLARAQHLQILQSALNIKIVQQFAQNLDLLQLNPNYIFTNALQHP